MPEPFRHLENLVELATIPGDLVPEAPHRNPSSSLQAQAQGLVAWK